MMDFDSWGGVLLGITVGNINVACIKYIWFR